MEKIMLDIFKSDAFSLLSLTDAINNLKFVPGRLGKLGLFTSTGVTTTSIAIEEKNGVLILVSPSPRGAPGQTVDKGKRKIRNLSIPHFEINDAIMADEVQGVRAFGSETELETVIGKVNERLGEHNQSFSATEEYARVGAFKGIITYADGSTTNLFTEFGVSQPSEMDFDLDNANPAEGVLRRKCAAVLRGMGAAFNGLPFSGVLAQCGDAFFDDLVAHKEVRDTFKNTSQAGELRSGYITTPNQETLIYSTFEFGGIIWENYRGQVGDTAFVDTNKCHFAPTGAPGLFRTYNGPADYNETVNTLGRRLYAKQYPMQNDKGVNLDVQMNQLNICTRPKCLQGGRRT
jgi:hypothetical protein